MGDRDTGANPFETVAMAQILLDQNLLEEAAEMIARLASVGSEDPRTGILLARLREMSGTLVEQRRAEARRGIDFVELRRDEVDLEATWELTDEGLAIARRRVRFSGTPILRLFTAAAGPRGVRKTYNDLELEELMASRPLPGLPRPAVHVAAVGFLGRNGAFVPLASCAPVSTDP